MSAADRALAERQQQGLPPQVTDAATVARVAALLRHAAPDHEREGVVDDAA